MPDIPDKVISDAVKAVPATQAGVGSARMVRQIVVPAAPVIAAWARDQERDRIMQQVHSRLQTMGGETDFVSQADHNAREDELETLLAALGWDGAK